MKPISQLLLSAALLACSTASYASLTNAWWSASNGGALVCTNTGWSSSNGGDLLMYGAQSSAVGNLTGEFYANSTADPRATKSYYIDNTSGQNWVGYDVEVYMDRAFSISNVVSTVPGDWTYSVTQPVLNADPLYYGAGEYVGSIVYSSGTPVADGSELDFAYDVGFSGSLTYRFEDTLSPVSVPEPGALCLAGLAVGLLAAARVGRGRMGALRPGPVPGRH